MFARFFQRKNPDRFTFCLHPSSKIPIGLAVRRYQPTDLKPCLAIYKENELGRFPPNQIDTFCKYLNNQEALILVLEKDGSVVATAGIHYSQNEVLSHYWLSYGIIDRSHQRQGFGTVMLLVRVALLPVASSPWTIMMTSVWRSQSFYERFGFRQIDTAHPDEAPVAGNFMAKGSDMQIIQSRTYLSSLGLNIGEDSFQIPTKK